MAFEFEKELAAFTQVMRDKLTENQHKTTWKAEKTRWLFERLKEEAEELRAELFYYQDKNVFVDDALRKRIAREAADVACFAMMIADVCGGLTPQPPEGSE